MADALAFLAGVAGGQPKRRHVPADFVPADFVPAPDDGDAPNDADGDAAMPQQWDDANSEVDDGDGEDSDSDDSDDSDDCDDSVVGDDSDDDHNPFGDDDMPWDSHELRELLDESAPSSSPCGSR